MWNLIHDGSATVELFETDDAASVNTSLALLQFNTLNEANSAITELGLTQPANIITLPPTPLDSAKAAATSKINTSYNTELSNGYTDVNTNITVAIDDNSRNVLFQDYQQLLLQGLGDTDATTIIDITGTAQNITMAQFKQIIIGGGNYYRNNLAINKSNLLSQISAATTIDEVNAIAWV